MARRVRRAVSSHVTVDGVTVKECATPLILFRNDRSSRTGSDRATTKRQKPRGRASRVGRTTIGES